MKLAFSTNAFGKFSAEEAIALIAKAGYSGAELMLDTPHLFPRDATPAKIASIRNVAQDAGITFSNANAFPMCAVGDTWNPSWVDDDPAVRKLRIQHTADALRIARELGIPSISTEPGGQNSRIKSRKTAMERFVAGLEEVLPVAEETGVDLLVEPEPHLLLETSDHFLELMSMTSHSRLALNFDIGHFYCAGEDPSAAYRKLKQYARHVHLEDIAATREHRHILPGTGAIDLRGILSTLDAENYRGWVTVELYPYQDAPYETAVAARKWLTV